ncbi:MULTISPECIES: hypothetical protein [Priestia]|jgi:hypothetical protein|uniref:hypothetical protein n=1 Tax=Priestia TaxID=2800373 RepID=UPI000BF303CD|nr:MULTISPECIES: hypothetical protein [Priestia]PFW74462.1 hypothetical protein COL23_17860 [Priestia aryabhattai]
MNWTEQQKNVFNTYVPNGDWISFMAHLGISQEEVMLVILDEEMTIEQYCQHGPPEAAKEVLTYYKENGALVSFDQEGLSIKGDKTIPPFRSMEKKITHFSLKERGFICQLAHQYLETHELTAEDIKHILEV